MIKLEENENIIKVFRKHWFSIVTEFFIVILMVSVPLMLFFLLDNLLIFDLTSRNLYVLIFLYILYIIFVWIITAIMWINYYLDIWILTDKRLVNVEQKNLFSREVSSLRLDRIQDVTVEVSGLINTILKIGNIHVQTASAEQEFYIDSAGNPEEVKHLVMQAHNQEVEKAKKVIIES